MGKPQICLEGYPIQYSKREYLYINNLFKFFLGIVLLQRNHK